MCDHEDCRVHVPVHLRHDFQKILRGSGVQSSGRFVCKQQRLPGNHGSGAGSALFLPAGYLIGKFAENIGDAESFRYFQNLFLYCTRVGMIEREGKTDVFFECQSVQQIKILKDKSQPLSPKTGKFIVSKL